MKWQKRDGELDDGIYLEKTRYFDGIEIRAIRVYRGLVLYIGSEDASLLDSLGSDECFEVCGPFCVE